MLDLTWLNLLSVCDIKEALIARTHLVPLLPVCDTIAIFSMETTYAVIFAHKSKSNTSFVTVKGLLLFVCTDNINKTFYKMCKIIL